MEKNFILETVVKEMRTGVVVLDVAGSVRYANPFFVKSFPVKDGVVGRNLSEFIKNTDLKKAVEDLVRSGVGGGGDGGGRGGGETTDIEINEGGRFFNVRVVPLREGEEFGLLLFLKDITEEKRVEAIKRDFVANVSHELRTPLASIKGYSETLLDGGIEKSRQSEFLRVIDRHATRMSRIIDDLLILSKLESHTMPIITTPVDIKELLASTRKGFEKQARDKGIRLTSGIPYGLPGVSGDRDRLEQVVANLLDNAIKYTPSGGEVHISATAEGSTVRVDVKDTGIGIPEEDMPRIFERFYRVDKARSRELGGTGLGLAIVKHIVHGHNGRLHVESTPGVGSTFSIMIPSVDKDRR